MCNIDYILPLLSWKRSPSEQAEGLNLARQVKCLKPFFQPTTEDYSKEVWGNCAQIICERTDYELMPYLIDMLLWLQDANWPGAEMILRRLLEFQDVDYLACLLNQITPALVAVQDDFWLKSVARLSCRSAVAEKLDWSTQQVFKSYLA